MKKLFLITALLFLVAVVACPPEAQAIATLDILDGTDWFTIVDQTSDDANPVLGAVTAIKTFGVWSVTVTTGISGSPDAFMDLNSIAQSNAAGLLYIIFTDTDFAHTGNAVATMLVGGTTGGTVNAWAGFDNSNAQYGANEDIGEFTFGPGAFSGTTSKSVTTTTPFSLMEYALITHSGKGISSFDAEVSLAPLPQTALLLGSGLLSLLGHGWWRRREE